MKTLQDRKRLLAKNGKYGVYTYPHKTLVHYSVIKGEALWKLGRNSHSSKISFTQVLKAFKLWELVRANP